MLWLMTGCFLLPQGNVPIPVTVTRPAPGCDDAVVEALFIETLNLAGEPVVASTVQWRATGEEWADAECVTEPCTSLAGAWQLTGDFELRASLTGEVEEAPCCFYDSWAEARVSVELDGQGCHPETAEVQLVIDTEDWACVDTGGC